MKYLIPIFSFLAFPFSVFASVQITEIMYDLPGSDTGREWVEITADTATDISGWKLFEANTNHNLTLISGSVTLPAGGVAVIADNADKFLIDYPSFSGNLFDSSFSLNNTGETITIRDADLVDIDSILYNPSLGGAGDGNSLQKVNGVWTAASPTPAASASSSTGSPQESQEGSSGQTETGQGQSTSLLSQTLWVDAGGDKTAIIGAGTLFEGNAFGSDKKPIDGARYFWNFGDGSTGEGKKTMHTYKYPGDYVVYLDVSNGAISAGDKVLVKAIAGDVAISALGYGGKTFVAVSNNEGVEIDISFWQIKSKEGIFVIPKNSIILPKGKIIFSRDVLGFEVNDGDEISLFYPNGSLAYNFSNDVSALPSSYVPRVNSLKPTVPPNGYITGEPEEENAPQDGAGPGGELSAAIGNSLPESERASSFYKWLWGAFAVAAFSVLGSMAIRNYRRREEESPEIKILE